MKIGIYGPYNFSEATRCGVCVASVAMSLGYKVSYLAAQSKERNVDAVCDSLVQAEANTDFKAWAAAQDHIVWCGTYGNRVREAASVGTRNSLVLLCHQYDKQVRPFLQSFNHIVCPSESVGLALERSRRINSYVHTINWSAGSASRVFVKSEDRPVSFYVALESNSLDKFGRRFFSCLDVLLDAHEDLQVVVAHSRRLATLINMRDLALLHPHRVSFLFKPQTEDRKAAMRRCDWAICPEAKPNTGFAALEALEMGCPVIVPKISPFSDFVVENYNGLFITNSQASEQNWAGGEIWDMNAASLLDTWQYAAKNVKLLRHMQAREWCELANRASDFCLAWRMIWEEDA